MRLILVVLSLIVLTNISHAGDTPEWAKPTVDCRLDWDSYPTEYQGRKVHYNLGHCRAENPRCRGSRTMYSYNVIDPNREFSSENVKCFIGVRCNCHRDGGH